MNKEGRRAWRIATALAVECGVDWGFWASGLTLAPTTAFAMRACGWTVAVHNDYRIAGEHRTFWLFTCGDRSTLGEGRTDEEAIAKAFVSANGHPAMNPPDPWNWDAYTADKNRRGVQGTMPALSWQSEDRSISWTVSNDGEIASIGVSSKDELVVSAGVHLPRDVHDSVRVSAIGGMTSPNLLAKLSLLTSVAAKAMGFDDDE